MAYAEQKKGAHHKAPAARRYLALHLPDWATDCLKRHDRDLAEIDAPLALYEKRDNAMRLAALDHRARAAGLAPGQALADARAICPGLIAREIDHAALTELFARFADWHANASPIVTVLDHDHPYGDLMLDITGVTHLFGGEPAMLARLTERLETLGFAVQAAIAPAIGAAWALSHYAPGTIAFEDDAALPSPSWGGWPGKAGSGGVQRPPQTQRPAANHPSPRPLPNPPLGHPREQASGRVFDPFAAAAPAPLPRDLPRPEARPHEACPGVAAAISNLPVEALRIGHMQAEGLRQMGLKTIGQLYGRDRRALQARFGDSLLARLDQALGHKSERLTPRLPVPERYADRKFAEPIGLIDDVTMTAADLAHNLSAQLEAEGLGAQTFHLMLFRVDHQVMHLAVNAARATRDAAHVARLFSNRIERLVADFDAGFGIEMIRLMATSTSKIDQIQAGAFFTDDGTPELDRLYDRMASRLGAGAVLRLKPRNSHIPERAAVLEPVVARTEDDPAATPSGDNTRPLRLLPNPETITVMAEVPDGPPARMVWRRLGYRFLKASGPERIGVEWWQPGEGALTRDYYICEDDEGRRFWLFREGLYDQTATPRWFLHGFFS